MSKRLSFIKSVLQLLRTKFGAPAPIVQVPPAAAPAATQKPKLYANQCQRCKKLEKGTNKCAVYPQGIPTEFFTAAKRCIQWLPVGGDGAHPPEQVAAEQQQQQQQPAPAPTV
jgi:hypothetical protein